MARADGDGSGSWRFPRIRDARFWRRKKRVDGVEESGGAVAACVDGGVFREGTVRDGGDRENDMGFEVSVFFLFPFFSPVFVQSRVFRKIYIHA